MATLLSYNYFHIIVISSLIFSSSCVFVLLIINSINSYVQFRRHTHHIMLWYYMSTLHSLLMGIISFYRNYFLLKQHLTDERTAQLSYLYTALDVVLVGLIYLMRLVFIHSTAVITCTVLFSDLIKCCNHLLSSLWMQHWRGGFPERLCRCKAVPDLSYSHVHMNMSYLVSI